MTGIIIIRSFYVRANKPSWLSFLSENYIILKHVDKAGKANIYMHIKQ